DGAPAGQHVLSCALLAEHDDQHERDDVHDPVPADREWAERHPGDRERAEGEGDRVEAGMGDDHVCLRARARASATNARTSGGSSPARCARPISTAGLFCASARYTTPTRRIRRNDAGTSDTPMPAATRLTIVCIWIASCSIRGVKPSR